MRLACGLLGLLAPLGAQAFALSGAAGNRDAGSGFRAAARPSAFAAPLCGPSRGSGPGRTPRAAKDATKASSVAAAGVVVSAMLAATASNRASAQTTAQRAAGSAPSQTGQRRGSHWLRPGRIVRTAEVLTPASHSSSTMSEEEAKKLWLAKLNAPNWGTGTSARPTIKRGKVKFYKEDKGWGYIKPEKKGEIDVFVHYSSIKKDGWRSLMPGEPVEYTVVVQSDGRVACGEVTGPDGADVIGFEPDILSDPRLNVKDWLRTVDTVVFTKNPLVDEDEIFDDSLYINDNDKFSN